MLYRVWYEPWPSCLHCVSHLISAPDEPTAREQGRALYADGVPNEPDQLPWYGNCADPKYVGVTEATPEQVTAFRKRLEERVPA